MLIRRSMPCNGWLVWQSCLLSALTALVIKAGDIEPPVAPPPEVQPAKVQPVAPVLVDPKPAPVAGAGQKAPGSEQEAPPQDQEEAKPKRAWKRLTPDQLVLDTPCCYLATSNFARARKDFERSILAALLGEEGISETVAETFEGLKEAYIIGEGTSSDFEKRRRTYEVELFQNLLGKMEGPVALMLETPTLRPNGSLNSPGFLLVMTMPWGNEEHQKSLASVMDRYNGALQVDPRYKDVVKKVGEYSVSGLECEDLGSSEAWAFVENLFLYGQGKGIVERAIKAYHEERGKGTLVNQEGYNLAFNKVGEDAALYLQLDLGELIKQIVKTTPATQALIGVPFLQSLTNQRPQLALGISVLPGENASLKERLLLRGVTPDADLRKLGPSKNISAYLGGRDVLFYQAIQGELAQGLQLLAKAAPAPKPPAPKEGEAPKPVPAAPDLVSSLRLLLQAKDDAEMAEKLAPFKGEMGFLLSYMPGSNFMREPLETFPYLLALEVNPADLEKAKDVLNQLRTATGLQYQKYLFNRSEIHYQFGVQPSEKQGKVRPFLQYLLPAASTEEGRPFFVAMTFVEIPPLTPTERGRTFLLLSDSLRSVEKAILQCRYPRQSTAERTDFKKLMSLFNEMRFSVNYIDLPLLNRSFYRDLLPTLLPLVARNDSMKRDILDRLPKENVLDQHLTGMAWASTYLNEGQLFEIVSPTGNVPLLGLGGAMAWSWYQGAQQQAISDRVTEQLREISLALHLYAADFDRLPERLSDLYPEYITDPETFSSPFRKGAVKSKDDVDDGEKTNLVYVSGIDLHGLSRSILVYEKEPTMFAETDQGVQTLHHILQLNGSVRGYPHLRLSRVVEGKTDLALGVEAPEAGGGDEAGPAGKGAGAGAKKPATGPAKAPPGGPPAGGRPLPGGPGGPFMPGGRQGN